MHRGCVLLLFVAAAGLPGSSGEFPDLSGYLADITLLTLSSSDITEIPAGAFDRFQDLEELRLDQNLITSIPAGAFDSLRKLKILDLGNNRLTALLGPLLDDPPFDWQITLDSNPLTTLPLGLFDGTTRRGAKFSLKSCDVTEIPVDLFSSTLNILTVDMQGTDLSRTWKIKTSSFLQSDAVFLPSNVCLEGAITTNDATKVKTSTPPACLVCGSGTYTRADSCGTYTVCAAGKYVQDQPSDLSDRGCADCLDGKYSTSENAAQCADMRTCPAGTHTDSAGANQDRTCVACDAGKYTSTANQGTCSSFSDCPTGNFVTQAGTSSSDRACTPCESGKYTSEPNQQVCVLHTVCTAGNYAEQVGTLNSDRACTPCESGKYTSETNQQVCTLHTICTAGNYAEQVGTLSSDRACAACATGTFANVTNQASCTPWSECDEENDYEEDDSPTVSSDRTCVYAENTCEDIFSSTNSAELTGEIRACCTSLKAECLNSTTSVPGFSALFTNVSAYIGTLNSSEVAIAVLCDAMLAVDCSAELTHVRMEGTLYFGSGCSTKVATAAIDGDFYSCGYMDRLISAAGIIAQLEGDSKQTGGSCLNFQDGTVTYSLQLQCSESNPSPSLSSGEIAGLVIGSVAAAAVVGLAVFYFMRRMRVTRVNLTSKGLANPAYSDDF